MALLWLSERGGSKYSGEEDERISNWSGHLDKALGDEFKWTFGLLDQDTTCVWCGTPVLVGEYRYLTLHNQAHICLDCAYQEVADRVPEPPPEIVVTAEDWLRRQGV